MSSFLSQDRVIGASPSRKKEAEKRLTQFMSLQDRIGFFFEAGGREGQLAAPSLAGLSGFNPVTFSAPVGKSTPNREEEVAEMSRSFLQRFKQIKQRRGAPGQAGLFMSRA